jgi:hypothetical protein
MIIKKHSDSSGKRWYEVRPGVFYKSYTTVLKLMPPTDHFLLWLRTLSKEQSDHVLKMAGLSGSKIHHAIELVLNGEEVSPLGFTPEQIKKMDLSEPALVKYLKVPFTEDEDKKMRAFYEFAEMHNLETIASELVVYSDKIQCAGTLDWYGYILFEGKKVLCIIDWKTGKSIHASHHRQLGGYMEGFIELIKGELAGYELAKPKKAFILHLIAGKKRGTYKLIEVKDPKKEYKGFLRVNEEWNEMYPKAAPAKDYEHLDKYKSLK